MGETSRREFVKTLAYWCLSGLGCCFAQSLGGCADTMTKLGIRRRYARGPVEAEKEIPPVEKPEGGFEPAYLKLHEDGELKELGESLWREMADCKLCPRACGANRLKGEKGFCQADSRLQVSSYAPNFGEERSLYGEGGSGAVFFTHCGLRCVYCPNWEGSQGGKGEVKRIEDLAGIMLDFQKEGRQNISLVNPTHYIPHVVSAVEKAAAQGLRLPLIYMSSGWERPPILNRLAGVVDVYYSDFKYSSGKMSAKYSSGAKDYPVSAEAALLEMQRQVGTAKPAEDGLIRRGLMIRHVVMPNGVSGTKRVADWIAKNLPKDTHLTVMSAYRPAYKAARYSEIARRITRKEYGKALGWVEKAGLTNLEVQGYGS